MYQKSLCNESMKVVLKILMCGVSKKEMRCNYEQSF